MRTGSYLLGHWFKPACSDRSHSSARIIGIVAIVLLAGSSALGQFIIQPMKVEMGVHAGKRLMTKVALENLTRTNMEVVDLRLVDMSQDPNGIWQAIEPDAQITEGPNGTRLVNVGTEENPIPLDISKLRSCRSWLRLETDTVQLDPLKRKEIGLQMTVPPGTVGYYCAALIAQTQFRPGETGIHASVILQFVVPVIIEVQGRVVRHKIKLTDVDLQYRPQQETVPGATLVTMGIENMGGTYNRLIGQARIWGHMGGHWQRITETDFIDTGIIPGVTLNLKEDVGRPLPSGKYRIEGFLYVDGRRSSSINKEIEYKGDDRIRIEKGDAALTPDPREITIEALPGATRGKSMTLVNASEETVIVDVEVALPDQMRHAVIVDGQGRTVRGDQMSCVEWLDVSPKQLTLRGYARRNLRVTAKMPRLAEPFPNYYATVRLKARYPDGSGAGQTSGQIYVETRGVEGQARIGGTGQELTLGESAPERYFVTAHFANSGLSHVMPRCRAILTTLEDNGPGMIRKRLQLSGDAYEGSGSMLPCETRKFAGVLDISDSLPGEYRLTAILEYGMGGSAQVQKGIAIKEQNGQKTIEFIGLDAYGGVTVIEL